VPHQLENIETNESRVTFLQAPEFQTRRTFWVCNFGYAHEKLIEETFAETLNVSPEEFVATVINVSFEIGFITVSSLELAQLVFKKSVDTREYISINNKRLYINYFYPLVDHKMKYIPNRVFVGGIPNLTSVQLLDTFSKVAPVLGVEIPLQKKGNIQQRHRGFAFVAFEHPVFAAYACAFKIYIGSRLVDVKLATARVRGRTYKWEPCTTNLRKEYTLTAKHKPVRIISEGGDV